MKLPSEVILPPELALLAIVALFILGVFYTSTPTVYILGHYCSEDRSLKNRCQQKLPLSNGTEEKKFCNIPQPLLFCIEVINIDTRCSKKYDTIRRYHDIENYGKIIGFLEKFVSIVLIIYGSIGGIVILFAAKALVTSQIKETKNTESLLLGTMFSLIISIIFGTLILWVLATSGNDVLHLFGCV